MAQISDYPLTQKLLGRMETGLQLSQQTAAVVGDVEQALLRCTEVAKAGDGHWAPVSQVTQPGQVARLALIQETQPDTAEGLLRRILENDDTLGGPEKAAELLARGRRLLGMA